MKPPDSRRIPGQPNRGPSARQAEPSQLDLFAERGETVVSRSLKPAAAPASLPPLETLTDDKLLELVPEARSSDVEAVCAEIVARSLPDAVPVLEALWRRFAGFGVRQPLREQLAVLGTLARLGGATAPSALRRIVLSEGLPASLVPAALRAAVHAGLALPAPIVSRFLGHEAGGVRAAALALAARANVPANELRDRLWDRYPGNRRLAAVALGLRGDAAGRQPLCEELARSPSAEVVEAIAGVWDDDVVVHLGRCARDHPSLAGAVLDALRDIGTVRAQRAAIALEAAADRPLSARALRGNSGFRRA